MNDIFEKLKELLGNDCIDEFVETLNIKRSEAVDMLMELGFENLGEKQNFEDGEIRTQVCRDYYQSPSGYVIYEQYGFAVNGWCEGWHIGSYDEFDSFEHLYLDRQSASIDIIEGE